MQARMVFAVGLPPVGYACVMHLVSREGMERACGSWMCQHAHWARYHAGYVQEAVLMYSAVPQPCPWSICALCQSFPAKGPAAALQAPHAFEFNQQAVRCHQGFLAEGLQRTSAGLGSVIIDSQPLTVAALAALLLGERLSVAGVAGLGVGVAGLCLLEVPPALLASLPSAAAGAPSAPAVCLSLGELLCPRARRCSCCLAAIFLCHLCEVKNEQLMCTRKMYCGASVLRVSDR